MATIDLNKVEIFRAGTWNGDKYTEKDLDDMVDSFKEIGDVIKPYLKLGHDENQGLLQKDGYPSAGWITNIYRVGKSLFADMKKIPEKIGKLIEDGGYGRFSSEIYWNLKESGKTFKKVLKAVALLGADTPAVGTMDDFINLYENNDFEKIVLLTNYETEESIMENDKTGKVDIEVNVDTDKAKKEIKNFSDNVSDELKRAQDQIKALTEDLQKVNFDKRTVEVNSYLDSQVDEGKILPAQREMFFQLLIQDDKQEKKYSLEEKTYSQSEIVKSIIENNVTPPELGELTEKSDVEEKTFSNDQETDLDKKENELDKKAKEYAKENGVSYSEAVIIVNKGGE